MIIKVNKLPGRAIGMALFPFILVKKGHENDMVTINHEKIHLRQQLEMLILPFYILYLLEWLFKFCCMPFVDSRAISFEGEAFEHETDLDYLKRRKAFAWIKYLF